MRTQYYTASSLDGFIATEDDSVDWLFPLGDPDDSSYPEFIANVGALVMGSSTYEWILRNSEAETWQVSSTTRVSSTSSSYRWGRLLSEVGNLSFHAKC